jgi:hypothetical protein
MPVNSLPVGVEKIVVNKNKITATFGAKRRLY